MAKMADIQKKNDQDLEKDLGALRESLRAFRFGIAGSKIRNMKEGRNLRRDIARHMTELTNRLRGERV
ncbi:MAG TPA: 50S ribosomal protein L29 [Candidatus Paceibacterota bacterium]|jgi:ribosomal protein L29